MIRKNPEISLIPGLVNGFALGERDHAGNQNRVDDEVRAGGETEQKGMQLAQHRIERPVKHCVRRHDGHRDGARAEGDPDRLWARARPPETLNNSPRDAQNNSFGQTELNDADQDKKEIHRERGKHHRQPDLQTRRSES